MASPAKVVPRVLDVHIEYCSSCGFRDHAASLKTALETAFGAQVGVVMDAGRATAFEVTTDNRATLVHSKLATDDFPEDDAIVAKVRELLSDPGRREAAVARHLEAERKVEEAGRNLSASDADLVIEGLLSADRIVVFFRESEAWRGVKHALHAASIRYFSVDLSRRPDGAPLEAALRRTSGYNGEVFVFVDGKFAGSLESVLAQAASGSLAKPVVSQASVVVEIDTAKVGDNGVAYIVKNSNPAGVKKQPSWPLCLSWPFFWFPYNVNIWTARITGILVFALSVICAVFAHTWWGRILIAAMFGDFLLRVLFGGRGSFLGALADALAEFCPIRVTPGPPKQFAQMIGALFTGASTLAVYIYLPSQHGDESAGRIAARVLMAVLAFCAALEGFLDICLGCLMYRILQWAHIFSKDPSAKADSLAEDNLETLQWFKRRLNQPKIEPPVIARFVGVRALPLVYKTKTEDQRKEDFNLIRHCSINYFAAPMGVAALAYAFKVVRLGFNQGPLFPWHRGLWVGTAILAAVIFCILLLLYIIKALVYPKKVAKEWDCPMRINSFATVTLTLELFAGLLADSNSTTNTQFAEFLFWAGGPANIILAAVIVARWIYRPHYRAQVNPAWMMAPVGCLICGAIFPSINPRYTDPAFLFFSFGILSWIILLPMTLQAATFSMLASPIRFTLFIYLAAPAAALVSYQAVTLPVRLAAGFSPYYFDTFALFLFYFTLGMQLVLFVLVLNNFFFRHRWSMDYWFTGFPTAALSIVCSMYYDFRPHSTWAQWLCYQSLIIMIMTHLVLGANTLVGLVSRQGIFVRELFLLPQQWALMTHFAFRPALAKLQKLAASNAPADRVAFAELFFQYKVVYESHACYEDGILFPAFEEYFPGLTEVVQVDHERDSGRMHDLSTLVAQLVPAVQPPPARVSNITVEYKLHTHRAAPGPPSDSPTDLAARVKALVDDMVLAHNAHFDLEEQHLAPVARKYFGIQRSKQLSRKMFESLPIPVWRKVMPFIINNMDVHPRRIAFLSTLLSGLPERAQLIGQMVHEGVSAAMWDRLAAEVPAMIPRGLQGHWHMY